MSGIMSFADGFIRIGDITGLVGTPLKGLTNRISRHPFLNLWTERPRQLLPKLLREVMPRRRSSLSFGCGGTNNI